MTPLYNTPRPYLSPDDIMEIATGFQRSRILLTAFELGIFSALGEERKGSDDVAVALRTDPRATNRLMNALCAIKLLHKEAGKFSNSAPALKFLVKGKSGYMAGLLHSANLWDTWGTLTEAVRTGIAVTTTGVEERSDTWREAFIGAMHYRAIWQASTVISTFNLSNIRRILDLGGGSGAYAMAFVREKDEITATVFDLPSIIPLTQQYLRNEGYDGKIATVAGDYLQDDLGEGFDLILLSAVIHSNGPEENRRLFSRVAKALAPKGRVVVQDFIVDEERTAPPFGAIFALNMLVGTARGDTYTEAEVSEWMRGAGLVPMERKDTAFGTALLIGWKADPSEAAPHPRSGDAAGR